MTYHFLIQQNKHEISLQMSAMILQRWRSIEREEGTFGTISLHQMKGGEA